MEALDETYLIIVGILFLLAAADLVIGVSNDAVNFLNSAIGSKVAPRHVIMTVASIGIFIGATFSSGMMEIARKGIFNPEMFTFGDVMVIFIAVMLTDILLLDFFNTIGLPTSTTVSIVFELLGATVVLVLVKVLGGGRDLAAIGNYVNSEKALVIISGIFISVIVAMGIGSLVQFFSRLLFTFRYKNTRSIITSVWSAVSLTAMTYFLLIKGLKGTSFSDAGLISYMDDNLMTVLAISLVFWWAFSQLLAIFKIEVLRIVVLFGTFSLAMAFAGNDLVNFIGVPMAGFESYNAWKNTGTEPFAFTMQALQLPIKTNTYILAVSGLVMIITLWFSKKARSVTETEVSLGRQHDGDERFRSNAAARFIVRYTIAVNNVIQNIVPTRLSASTRKRFDQPKTDENDAAAFDLVRASVNLTVASVLIAFATSLKLPLSTTYVSFMVAMGTSLSDRAWGRDSAVFRISGVISVIGGWLATAVIAFSVSAIMAAIIYKFGMPAIIILLTIGVVLVFRSFKYHQKHHKKKQLRKKFELTSEKIKLEKLYGSVAERISEHLALTRNVLVLAFDGLQLENLEILNNARISISSLKERNDELQFQLYRTTIRVAEVQSEGSRFLLYVYDLEQDLTQAASVIVESCHTHVQNVLNPLGKEQLVQLETIQKEMTVFLTNAEQLINDPLSESSRFVEQKLSILRKLEESLSQQISGIKDGRYSAKNSQLMFRILLELKDIVAVTARLVKLKKRIVESNGQPSFYSFSSKEVRNEHEINVIAEKE